MKGFYGEFEHTMDAKGRVSLPAKFRKELPDNIVIAPGPNRSLNIFAPDDFDSWKESLFESDGGYKSVNKRHVKTRMFINSKAARSDVDSAGRIMIPSQLREHAGLGKQVFIFGDEDHVCLWDKGRFDDYMSDFDPDDIWADHSGDIG